LSDYGAAELYWIVAAKRPDLIENAKAFLKELNCEFVNSPLEPNTLISDPKDMPIVNAAILADVDIIISGDKHFLDMNLQRPKVMTVADFLEKETSFADVSQNGRAKPATEFVTLPVGAK
jgi:predicted nucleic acid-binding protein